MHCRTKMSYGLKAHILEDIQVGAQSSQVKSVIRAPIPLGSRHWYIPNTSHISMQGSVFNSCWYCSERTITVTQHQLHVHFQQSQQNQELAELVQPVGYTAAARGSRVQKPQITGESHSRLLLRGDTPSESCQMTTAEP